MIEINVSSKKFVSRLFWSLVGLELFILFGDVFLNFEQWIGSRALRRTFNITREDSLANWFSSTQTFFVGLVLLLIIYVIGSGQIKSLKSTPWILRGWKLIAGFFFFMAIDDATKLHERLGTAFKNATSVGDPSALALHFPSYTWHLVLGPFFVAMGLFIFAFLWKQMREQRKLIFTALAILAFAMFLDYLEGVDRTGKHLGNLIGTRPSFAQHMFKAVEETLEMFANTLFLTAFLKHLISLSKEWRLKWTS